MACTKKYASKATSTTATAKKHKSIRRPTRPRSRYPPRLPRIFRMRTKTARSSEEVMDSEKKHQAKKGLGYRLVLWFTTIIAMWTIPAMILIDRGMWHLCRLGIAVLIMQGSHSAKDVDWLRLNALDEL